MHLMDQLNAMARRHQEDGEAARRAAQAGPAGPPVLKAPILSAWLIGGAVLGFGVGYLTFEAIPPAAVTAVLAGVAARIFQGILRAFGIGSADGSAKGGLGGLALWIIGGAILGAVGGAAFMIWLDGMNADIATPMMVTAPAGAAGGLLIKGLMLLGGRRKA